MTQALRFLPSNRDGSGSWCGDAALRGRCLQTKVLGGAQIRRLAGRVKSGRNEQAGRTTGFRRRRQVPGWRELARFGRQADETAESRVRQESTLAACPKTDVVDLGVLPPRVQEPDLRVLVFRAQSRRRPRSRPDKLAAVDHDALPRDPACGGRRQEQDNVRDLLGGPHSAKWNLLEGALVQSGVGRRPILPGSTWELDRARCHAVHPNALAGQYLRLARSVVHDRGLDGPVRGGARRGPDNQRRLMCLSMFWHFLDVIWIGVFTFVYLMGSMR